MIGSSIDWVKGTARIKYVFALELRDEGRDRFDLSTSEIIPTGEDAFCAVSILAETIVQSSGTFHNVKSFSISDFFVLFIYIIKVFR